MDAKELITLSKSSEAPYNHEDYTVWLHNQIIDKINYDLWNFREKEAYKIKSTYAACNHIMNIPSLKKI